MEIKQVCCSFDGVSLVIRLYFLFLIVVQAQGGRVTRISPVSGSVRGATKLTIYGDGFAESQFNYYQPELGNNVTLISVTGTHAVACDVIPYYTTRQQIVCHTRPSPFGFGAYNVRVQVDGVLLRSIKSNTYCNGECVFKYEDKRTPTVTSVSPKYGLPGSLITIRGKIFTDQYDAAEGTNPDGVSILRVFVGSGLCEPINQETKTLYGLAFDRYGTNTGYIKCKSVSARVGSHRVSYITSSHGRSLMSKDALLVDSQEKLYIFQAHSDVIGVSPSQGSTAGGTAVTIKGQGFRKNNTHVHIGGIPCRVLSVLSDTITCQTGQGFDSLSSEFYPGNRGILREVWTSTIASDLSSIANLDSSAPDYHSEVLPDANSPSNPSFGEKTMFSSRLRGFFVAPSDNNYTFFIQADDKAELYLSTGSLASKKRKIASCPDAATNWNEYPDQRSAVFTLKAGHAYYMEAYHLQTRGSSHVCVGVKIDRTKFVNSQIGSAVNEKQVIRVLSTECPETQIINVTNWDSGLKYEVQRISVTPNCTGSNKSFCGNQFQLRYSGYKTVVLGMRSTAEEVQAALNDLEPITQQGNVTVTMDNLTGACSYNVTFIFALPSKTELLESLLVDNGAFVTVKPSQKGKNGNWKFRFSLGPVISNYIRVNATGSDLKAALQSILSWKCGYQIPTGRAWYYNGFESKAFGPEFGERVVDERPFCGRTSLRNPTYIFRAGQTRDLGGRVLNGIDVSKYRQLCFAYKGAFQPYLNFYVSYTDQSGNGRRVWRKYSFTSATTMKWFYHCMSIHDNIYSDSYLNGQADKDYGYYVDIIKTARDSNTDIYIDDVIIWRDSISVLRKYPAAEPGGHVIKSFDVQQMGSAAWAVYLTPAHCGTDIEMIKIVDAVKDDNRSSNDVTTYRYINQTKAIVTVVRVQEATPPISGTFDLAYKGQRYSGISSSISASQLKSKLENNLNIGQVNVTRTGTCAGYNWTIEWATFGGNQPNLEIDGSGLTGNEVSAKSETVDDGGMFLRPIPGDMLRVAEQKPQVSVVVNNIPSSCSTRKCSFLYSSISTPTLTAVAPNKGKLGTTLHLTGSGFSTAMENNNVTIGSTPCHVTGSTSSTITCTADHSVGGINEVNVNVKNLGFAKHVNGRFAFVQEVTVTKVTPNTGSVSGGTTLSIIGSGFSLDTSQITVTLGSSNCALINSSLSHITCMTTKHVPSREDVQVKVQNQTGILSQAFEFDQSVTPIIKTISPLTQSVDGMGELVISGTNLGSRGTVVIGHKTCQISVHYPSLIKCTIPAHAPGIYDVIISVPGKGYASFKGGGPPRLEYVLEVTDLYPRQGSVFGGTLVTIRGRGFSAVKNMVLMDGVPCAVVSSRSDQILCKTTDSSVTHYVHNSGIHPEYGLGYAWNPQTIIINSGDTIKWSWSSPEMTNLKYGIQQTNDSSSTAYDGKGFKSERSGSGSFHHRFNVPGTYYYSSGSVDPYDVINMKGKVVVTSLKSKTAKLTVQVGNFTAVYNQSQNDPLLPSSYGCHSGITSNISQCTPSTSLTQHPSFEFRECNTPRVTSISPNIGSSSSLLTIRGVGFGISLCYNEVTVSSQQCITLTSASDVITCRLTTDNALTAGIPYDVNVRVNNRGNAWILSDAVASKTFTLLPTVSSVSPLAGSLVGGTVVTLSGTGFSLTPEINSVKIGPTNCTVISASHSVIKCITQPHTESRNMNVSVIVNNMESICVSHMRCSFTFSDTSTPRIDYVAPTSIIGDHNVINFYGTGLLAKISDISIKFGNESCNVLTSTQYAILCSIGTVVGGSHAISVRIDPKGYAMLDADAAKAIVSLALVSHISPTEGSKLGGTELTIIGNGFDPRSGQTTVLIGANRCMISQVTNSKITCTTSPHRAGSFEVDLTSGGKVFSGLRFAYRTFLTPVITSIFPARAMGGETLRITGQGLGIQPSKLTVTIGNSTCRVHSVSSGRIMCVLLEQPAGVYDVVVHVKGKGFSGYLTKHPITLTYDISIVSVSAQESGLGGGKIITIQGQGFSKATVVKICNGVCIKMYVSSKRIRCEVPPYQGRAVRDVSCPLAVYGANSVKASKMKYFTYRIALTSWIISVIPFRGGTGGGVTITVTGSGFSTTSGGNKVSIAGVKCTVTSFSSTQIKCVTGQRSGFIRTKVRVEVENRGISTMDNADFEYADVWSSRYTWGYKDPPMKGDLVVIHKGQTMILDVSTPVLAALVIKGKLIFDENDLVLNAEKILVVDGGVLEVGTESKPFQHKARIVLHGSTRSIELPLFGAKVLAVREGILDLHGKQVPITWTQLQKTADIGATQLILKEHVTWSVGDDIVIASTSRHPGENEELTITSVSSDGRTIGIRPALKYKHISIVQTIAGKVIETRAEVGLLTRNVVVEGSVQREWTDDIRQCPEDFDPDQFATQTCFNGRYGSEEGSDQFGSQIMLNAKEMNKGLVTGRISYTEVRHAGQAFKLGRYPIHFHMSGDVTGSYVRGCAIHHTFNRAVTIHGVNGLLVEHNVAYHVMGHAYFIEDGIETGNTIQYNLGVYVTSSSSLLNVDVTPGTFWITNPNNTVRHNAAAGGSHFGFWYNMPLHPGGPSYTPKVWPRKTPLGEFRNNTAHSFGRYGLWIFPTYIPLVTPTFTTDSTAPAKFQDFTAYNNLKGFEVTEVGAVQAVNCTMLDNTEAGFEVTIVKGPWSTTRGGALRDCLVVGYSAISENNATYCTMGGVVGPQSSRLILSGVTFVNFDASKCAALRGCSFCRPNQGGWTVKLKKSKFIRSPNKAGFLWQHETVYHDLDGSLTGFAGGTIVATNENLSPQHCTQSPSTSLGKVPGSICDATLKFRRFAWNNPLPTNLLYKDALLSNQHGTSHIPWASMRLTHKNGWMATIMVGENYNFTFENAQQLSNISYSGRFYEFEQDDYVLITHPMKYNPDIIKTTGKATNMSSGIPQPPHASTGDWFYNNVTKDMTYIVTGESNGGLVNRDVKLQVIRCFYKNCIKPIPPPPPEKRPLQYLKWSDPESWYGTQQGYGGYKKQLPVDGDDVMIKHGWWMVADTKLPTIRKLIIYGTLELEPSLEFELNATYIFVAPDANLIIGWPDQPMSGRVVLSLQGNWDTPDLVFQDAPNIGAKAVAIFGNLEIHGKNKTTYWTRLERTAEAGARDIRVKEAVDWREGDVIVIAPTSYRSYETEVMTIESVSEGGKTIRLLENLKHKHVSMTSTIASKNFTLAAEVGLLTRNIVIEGADEMGLQEKQAFGCRVLVSSMKGSHKNNKRRIRIQNVEFKSCGQDGWSDYYDPRYSLAFLDVPFLSSSSFVRGNSFHHGFNTGLGVFGVNGLLIQDNVIHRALGSSFRVTGSRHRLLHNLAVLSVSPATFKGRQESMNLLWHSSFEINRADELMLQDNAAAGSERIGFHIRGVKCYTADPINPWFGNSAHSCLHGVHIGYNDGYPGCAKVANFLSWKNWDYGVFAYPSSRVMVEDCILADNKAGVLINVYAPPSLSHNTADKFVQLDRVLIIGTSPSFDCSVDTIVPMNAHITAKARGPRANGGGHIGFVLSTFSSGSGLAPEFPWHMIESYPAINGITRINSITFSSFGTKCGKRSVAIMTNPLSPDAMHPTEVRDLSLHDMNKSNLVLIEPSKLGWINPSDCVDMDCDGHKEVLITDVDGSMTGSAGGTIISKAEYEWDGDPRRGLGDYRIPKAMLTGKDGSRLNASVVAPHHGIVRGTRIKNFCKWNVYWNAYSCKDLDHKMLVIESMDADTEVRRLSPVALSADGYTNLLNGPQDHGWCFGYTCQERISTFYAIVATERNYTLYFTGTNPEKLRLRLLNSESNQVLRLAIWYSKPERLDVYRQGIYIYPTNADLKSSGFTLKKKDPSFPDDQFEPPLTSISGSNYFDNELKMLMVVVRGGNPVDIRTMPIIQVTIGAKPVHVNDFFEKNLIANLAVLLNIDQSRIRVVEIVNAAGRSRRRRAVQKDDTMKIKIQISNPPPLRIPFESEDRYNENSTSGQSTSPPTSTTPPPYPDVMSYVELKQLSSKIVEAAQTKKMSITLKFDVLSIDVVDPDPPRVDPTGGVRATNETGGPPNGTWSYDEIMKWKEGNRTILELDYLIPTQLIVTQSPGDANETVPFGLQPKILILDAFNRTVKALGHGNNSKWFITATIRPGTGPQESMLGGNTSIPFIDGWANFTGLYITHTAKGYIIDFTITSPTTANITASSGKFDVDERILYFTLVSSPSEANETVPFDNQPAVEVRDAANGRLVSNTGWKGRIWLCTIAIENPSKNKGYLNGSTTIEFISGVARFTNLSIDYAGSGYILRINADTMPASRYSYNVSTNPFNVKERQLRLVIVQQPGGCNDTVTCGFQPIIEIQDLATNRPVGNIGWRGRKWIVSASIDNQVGTNQLNGTIKITVPKSGRVEYFDIKFNEVASGYKMKFEVRTLPYSSFYSKLTAISKPFDVQQRRFYLQVITQPSLANASEAFGNQPVVEVRDVGTRARATPLKTTWTVTASLFSNPKPRKSILKGNQTVLVSGERAVFRNLMITEYGEGFVLGFASNTGRRTLSDRFEVRYVNDYSPEFIPNNATQTKSLSEGVSIGTSVLTVSASDKDKGSQGVVSYSIHSGNIRDAFSIDKHSGIIATRKLLDREVAASYALVIRASDKAVTEKIRFADMKVVVIVTDLNDNAPVFAMDPLKANVTETSLPGHVIVQVKANDPDAGRNGEMKFNITDGNKDGYFRINENSGDIIVNKALDLESQYPPMVRYALVVMATDLGTPKALHNTSSVVITVTPVNEFAPHFIHSTSRDINIKENVAVGDKGLELVDVNATDRDYGTEGQVTYSIASGNSEGRFNISKLTGVVRLLHGLNYERTRDYTLVIRATDGGSGGIALHVDYRLRVHVEDVNDNKPLFSSPLNVVNVPETLITGQTAFVVKATDADFSSNGDVSYSIQTGNDEGYFRLNSTTGEIKLMKSLDLETLRVVDWNRTLKIRASDHGVPQLTSSADFEFRLMSVNEFLPVFVTRALSLRLIENINVETMIGQVSARDKDFGSDGQIRYTIISGNNERKFRVESTSGKMFINAPLDREHTSQFSLEIQAKDHPSDPALQRRSLTRVNITLEDANDNKPVFTRKSYYAWVKETAETGSDVITVQAYDLDLGTNGEIHYSILSGNSRGFFMIDSKIGKIGVKRSLNLETQKHVDDLIYVLTIGATDKGSPIPLSNAVIVTIEIKSVNEFSPQLQQPSSLYIRIPHTTGVGTLVININATDADFGSDGTLKYKISNQSNDQTFAIDKDTGKITVAKKLDYSILPRYFLNVEVSDKPQNDVQRTVYAMITVRLTTANDSGGTDFILLGLVPRLTTPGNTAQIANVPVMSNFNIGLLFSGELKEILPSSDKRVLIDDKTLSRGLFSVAKGDLNGWVVHANTAGRLGEGVLVVHVRGVYNLHVKINLIGFRSLKIEAALSSDHVIPNNNLQRVGQSDGGFEQAKLMLYMGMTDDNYYDVTDLNYTTYHVINNNAGVVAKIGPIPKNLLRIDRASSSGQLSAYGKIGYLTSPIITLNVINKFVTLSQILSVDFPSLTNKTLLGTAGDTIGHLRVTMVMSDSTVVTIDNFEEFSGVVEFDIRPGVGASVDQNGLVSLKQDSSYSERVMVRSRTMANDFKSLEFFCNIEPSSGGVDIGDITGPAITSYNRPIPVRINTTGFALMAYNFTLEYDDTSLQFQGLKGNIPYSLRRGRITLINVVNPVNRSQGYLTDLTFLKHNGGDPFIRISSVTVLDKALSVRSKDKTRYCPSLGNQLGDVDSQCGLDLFDPATTMLCSLSLEHDACRIPEMKRKMDFNKNGIIEEIDAFLLVRAALDQVRFVKTMTINKPDHRNKTSQCALSIVTSLVNKDGTPARHSDTQVYFEFSSKQEILRDQIGGMVFVKGELIKVYQGYGGLWGAIIRAVSRGDGVYELKSLESLLDLHDLGISMIQVTQNPLRPFPSVVPFFDVPHSPLYSAKVDVLLTPNARLLAAKGHSPQLLVNIQSTSLCKNPNVTKNIEMKFKNDFSSVITRKEKFTRVLLDDLGPWKYNVTIGTVKLSPGSISVQFKASGRLVAMNAFIEVIWRSLESGYSIEVDGIVFVALKELNVDGKQHKKPEVEAATSSFPVSTVVAVCVVMVVFILMIGGYTFYRKRKLRRENGNAKWRRIKKMSSINSRSNLSLNEPPDDHEMTFINRGYPERSDDEKSMDSTQGNALSNQIPGTPDIPRMQTPRRVGSATSRESFGSWCEEGQERTYLNKKEKLSPANNGKVVSAHRLIARSTSPQMKLITKQNSSSRLIGDDTDSDVSATSSPEIEAGRVSPFSRNNRKVIPEESAALEKNLNCESPRSPSKRKKQALKEPLQRQCSDSRLIDLKRENEKNGSLYTRPKLHKKITWTGGASPRSLSPQFSNSSLPGLPGSTESSPPGSGSATPQYDCRAVTPSSIKIRNIQQDDIIIQDEPFTVRLPVNVLNTAKDASAGPFIKLGFIEIQTDNTLTDVRQKLIERFDLKKRCFVFEDVQMMDITPLTEDEVIVGDTFSVSIIIKMITDQAEVQKMFCICNKVAKSQCSACYRRGYCGRDCQSRDWNEHKKECYKEPGSAVVKAN